MKYVYGRKKWLAAGIAALLISGAGVVPDVLAAPVYTSGITTKAKKDKATFGSAYKVENGVNKYNLEDGSKISIHGTYYAEGITPGKGTTSVVTVGDGTGTLSAVPEMTSLPMISGVLRVPEKTAAILPIWEAAGRRKEFILAKKVAVPSRSTAM